MPSEFHEWEILGSRETHTWLREEETPSAPPERQGVDPPCPFLRELDG
jgi:hypothetical protein